MRQLLSQVKIMYIWWRRLRCGTRSTEESYSARFGRLPAMVLLLLLLGVHSIPGLVGVEGPLAHRAFCVGLVESLTVSGTPIIGS